MFWSILWVIKVDIVVILVCLTSNENMIVKQLFNRNIRSNFMRFSNKGYRISGQKNMLIIITNKVVEPENYPSIISDMKVIDKFMKTNSKFYNPEVEVETEATEEMKKQRDLVKLLDFKKG